MSILVLNAGSSSLKFSLFDDGAGEARATGIVDWVGGSADAEFTVSSPFRDSRRIHARGHEDAVARVLDWLADTVDTDSLLIGHRVVHGGEAFRQSVRITPEVRTRIAELRTLAPLHNPPALAVIEAVDRACPDVPNVAVFDTAFYSDMPPSQYVYPLPYAWFSEWGIRRFGFHGINQSYCARRAAQLLGRKPSELDIVSCHLGNGVSAAAIRGGRGVATTMGFTPLEGMMMGTRGGDVDPGILLHVLRERGLTPDELDDVLNRQSGLLGLSGVSSDYRKVEAAAREGNERARLALDVYATRVRSAVGSLATTLGRLDAVVFTGGVGENSVALRSTVCEGLRCLGVELDPSKNVHCEPDADVAADDSQVRVLVIRAREDLMIARETIRVVQDEGRDTTDGHL